MKRTKWRVDPEPEGVPFALGWDQVYHQNGFRKGPSEPPSCFKRNGIWWNGYPKPDLYNDPDFFSDASECSMSVCIPCRNWENPQSSIDHSFSRINQIDIKPTYDYH